MEDRRIQASYLQIDKGIFANNITSTGNFQVSGSGVFNNEVIAPNLVYNTGNQTISGFKTFATGVVVSGNLQVSGTGIFNALDLNNIDSLSFSGVDVTITSGIVTLTNAPILSGNPLITGNLSLYATTANLISTGSRIDTLSGNLITTGSRIDTLSGQVVFTTGNQTISGIKSFATGIDIINSGNPQNLRVFNKTGTNTGEFGIFGWNNNQLTIGAQQTNSGILRDIIFTGANMNLNASGAVIITNRNPPNTSSFILKEQNGNNSVFFNPTQEGGAGALFSNYIYSSNIGSRDDDDFLFRYGGGGTRSVKFLGYNGSIQPTRAILDSNGNFGIGSGISSVPSRFYVSGNSILQGDVTVSGNTTITGHLSAASKSFLIDHPTQIGKKLQYGSLEGPEHGVFVRGKTNENIINLPNYWASLVDENSISVNLTPIDVFSNIYVVEYNNRRVVTDGNNGNYYFYTVYGERKDIPKLTVEF